MHENNSDLDGLERGELPPLDMFEGLFSARQWSCERIADEELNAEYKGSWTTYQIRVIAREEDPVLQLLVLPDINIGKAHNANLFEALALINEQLWIGHFDLWSNNGVILFRHACVLASDGLLDVEQAQTMIDAAMDECERFYPVFQFVLWGGKSAKEAIASALIDTHGEA